MMKKITTFWMLLSLAAPLALTVGCEENPVGVYEDGVGQDEGIGRDEVLEDDIGDEGIVDDGIVDDGVVD